MLRWIPPGLIVWVLLVLIVSQLFYALLPARPRTYWSVLALTATGFLAGQGWDALGLPALHIGQANVLPGALFALVLQPLAPHLPIRLRRG